MLSHVVVVNEPAFKAWYFGPEGTPEPTVVAASVPGPAQEPEALALMRPRGCLGCHSTDGKPMVGPTFRGLYGKQEEVVTGSGLRWVTMDDERLRLAIWNRHAKLFEAIRRRCPQFQSLQMNLVGS